MELVSSKGYSFSLLSNQVIGVATTVHKKLGPGFLEYTYSKAIAIELARAKIDFQREVDIPIYYDDELIDSRRADLVVVHMIVELKAVEKLIPDHIAQVAMYLKAAKRREGLVLNFGAPRLQIRHVINSSAPDEEKT